jgi:hypothetical protein
LKSKVNLRLASATWVLSSNSLVLAHTVKYYNQEAGAATKADTRRVAAVRTNKAAMALMLLPNISMGIRVSPDDVGDGAAPVAAAADVAVQVVHQVGPVVQPQPRLDGLVLLQKMNMQQQQQQCSVVVQYKAL